jgi:hypothetical protein
MSQQHPFLQDPENARGYAHLLAVPLGTVRTWAKSLGWSRSKTQRFLASLSRYQIGEVQSCKTHSVFRPLDGKSQGIPHHPSISLPAVALTHDVSRCVPGRPGMSRCVPAALGSAGLERKEPSATADAAGSEYSRALIVAMNDALSARFKESYRPRLLDNKSSIAAAGRLELAGVPVDKAEAHLLIQCRLFNPSKHGKGELPKSLAYFERGVLKAWRTEAQLQIPLMQLERSSTDPGPKYQQYVPPAPDLPPAKPETIDSVMNALRQQLPRKQK